MPSSLSTTLHSFFGGSGSTKQGDSLGGFLKKVLPIPGGEEEGPEDQFASWLPYSAYIPEERLFVNRETLGFMLEVIPQSGADERMAEILVSLYATCPPGTGIQWIAVRLASCARLLVAIRQPARGRRRPRRKSQALRASGSQHQPVPHPCPQARGPSSARCTQLAHQGLPLHGARLQVELKRVRRGQHRQHDDARRPAAAARKHLDHAARGLLSEPRSVPRTTSSTGVRCSATRIASRLRG